MFTGLIEEVGTLANLASSGSDQYELTLNCNTIQSDLKVGDSVAVDGVCLTVIRFGSSSACFDVSAHTFKNTLFGTKQPGSRLNLERALRLGDRLGGHLVQGHVDSQIKMVQKSQAGEFFQLWFEFAPETAKYLIDRGSVSLNGISLTIAALKTNRFMVAVIPQTYLHTNLSDLKSGDLIHLETDLLGRYVERMLTHSKAEQPGESKVNEDFLRQNGFF